MKVLLSIKPEFVRKIFFKSKKYEFRKVLFRKEVESVVVYSTMPVGRIVGEFTISNILSGKPDVIWEQTKEYSGITHQFYIEYFMNRKIAHAIEIGNLIKYEIEINPFIKIPNFVAPQSFRYI